MISNILVTTDGSRTANKSGMNAVDPAVQMSGAGEEISQDLVRVQC